MNSGIINYVKNHLIILLVVMLLIIGPVVMLTVREIKNGSKKSDK